MHALARPRLRVFATIVCLLVTGCGLQPADSEPDQVVEPTGTPPPRPEAKASQSRGARLVRVGGRFRGAVYVTAPPGDRRRLFVVQKEGLIRVVRGGRTLSQPFLDLRGRVSLGSEQGLLSMAFAPDYARSGHVYVSYTDRAGDSRIVEYRRASADRADARSARQVLSQPQPEANHNGGLILFGPDRLLYIGFGDGGGGGDRHGRRGNGQDLGTWLGKILRIDPRASGGRPYSVPRSNPFAGRAGARPEIYSYGLRNPWRFSFDRSTGDLSIGDVGQNAVEEVSFVRRGRGAGANFGWRPYEGTHPFTPRESAPGHVEPVFERTHNEGWCSITGGVVVRDRSLGSLYGRYLVGDFCQTRILSMRLRVPRAQDVRATSLEVESLASFGEDARGRVYVVSLEGAVYRLAPR